MKSKQMLIAILLAMLPLLGHAQVRLSGQVFDEDGKTPLPGVNIRVDNSLNGGTTNIKGEFSISNLPEGKHTLNFSYVGYETQKYATEGSQYRVTGSVVYGNETYTPSWAPRESQFRTWLQLSAKAEHYFPMLPHITIGVKGELFASTKKRLKSYTGTIVQAPGFTPTPHSQMVFNEGFHANQYIAGGIIPIYKIMKNLQLRSEFYAFSPFRKILRDED